MFLTKFFSRKLSVVDGRSLVLETPTVSDIWESLEEMSDDDIQVLFRSSHLALGDRVLLFDILSSFNSLEMNFNRLIGLGGRSGRCTGLKVIVQSESPVYLGLFETDLALGFRQVLSENLEIRNLIAHGLAKKYKAKDSILFLMSDQKDWKNKVRSREKNPEEFINRQDGHVILNELPERHIGYAVLSTSSLRGFRSKMWDIEKYFCEYVGLKIP